MVQAECLARHLSQGENSCTPKLRVPVEMDYSGCSEPQKQWFTLLHAHSFVGLIYLGILDLAAIALTSMMFLALCVALRRALFLYYGRSRVTGSTLLFHMVPERV